MAANDHVLNGFEPSTLDPPATSALLVPVTAAARLLGIGRTKAYELIDAGELELVHIGRSALVPTESVHAFVRRLRADASAEPLPCRTPVVQLRSSPSGDSQPPAA
jgi:excisionase family DNA binding protein